MKRIWVFMFVSMFLVFFSVYSIAFGGAIRNMIRENRTQLRTLNNVQASYVAYKNIVYKQVSGVSSNLLSLDIYKPNNAQNSLLPIVIGVHGWGFRTWDKETWVKHKAEYFTRQGFIFVSVNYRLSPNFLGKLSWINANTIASRVSFDPNRVRYPIHQEDVADAIAWIYTNAQNYQWDNTKITLIGHSAGSIIVSLISTNKNFLESRGVPFDRTVRCSILLDGDGFDVERKATPENGVVTKNVLMYWNAFATPEENERSPVWREASPIHYVRSGIYLPKFFIVWQGSEERVASIQDFVLLLHNTGHEYQFFNTTGRLDHEEISDVLGNPNDRTFTPFISEFLGWCR